MAFTLARVRTLLGAAELELFQLSRRDAITSLTAANLQSKINRTRALRDKYRDLYQRQTISTRTGPAASRKPFGGENARTDVKAEVMAEVLTRFEERLAKLQAAQPMSAPAQRYPAPGARARSSSAPRPAERIRKPATAVIPDGPADRPMRGATKTGQRAISRKDRAAAALAEEVVSQRAADAKVRAPKAAGKKAKKVVEQKAAKDSTKKTSGKKDAGKKDAEKKASKSMAEAASTPKKASKETGKKDGKKDKGSTKASAKQVSLTAAVKKALDKKAAPPKRPSARKTTPRRGSAKPSLAAAPTDFEAVAEHRLDPLKAKPGNKKIHASARGRKQQFQAKRDSR